MADLTKLGSKTPRVVTYKSESHKLCQAFQVKAGDVINEGAPVMLNADGTISPYFGTGLYIGIATSFSTNSPYPESGTLKEQTVMVEGFAIVNGISKAAFAAGYVVPDSAVANTNYTKYAYSEAGAPLAPVPTEFISLNAPTAADELIQILIK